MTGESWPPEWGVADATLLSDGIGGRVWRVAYSHGTAIVKHLSDLAIRDRADGESWLRWRGGAGAIRLLDKRGPLLLLEDAHGPSLLDVYRVHGDDCATEIAGWTLRKLHRAGPGPSPRNLLTLSAHFSSLLLKAKADSAFGIRSQFTDAAALAQRLLDDQRGLLPLHGDFHHENVLLSPRGWLAIDPRGVIGDPAYDVANWFYNPLESEVRYQPVRAMEIATALSPSVERAPEVLLDWAFAHSALSAAWHVEDGNGVEAEKSLRVGRCVAEAARQVRS